MAYLIGIDLGGTNLRAGIVNPDSGEVLATRATPTVAREGHDAVIERMVTLVNTLIASSGLPKSQISGVGVGLPGRIDLDKNEIVFLPNLADRWEYLPFPDIFSPRIGLPVYMLNDVRAITYGEWKFGAGRGVDTMACLALGTGVGGGLVIDGKLHLGIGGAAGELGHQTIDFNGPMCGCGNRGCLEVYTSGPTIRAMGLRVVAQGLTTSIGRLVDYDLNRITPEVIAQAANEGDAIAQDIYNRAGTHLGIGIANILLAISPRKVVLAGGVAAAGELLLGPARRAIAERAMMMPTDQVEIVLASLGANSGIIGMARWTAERLNEKR